MVLDTSAFLAGFDPFSVSEDQATVPKVKEEIRNSSMPWVRFKTAVENGKLKVKAPSEDFWNKVKASANRVGDSFFLSETDMQILALALELKAEGCASQIVTDDYSIQNVANALNLKFQSVNQSGITKRFKWDYRCRGCGKRFKDSIKICPICGTETKSIISNKKEIKNHSDKE